MKLADGWLRDAATREQTVKPLLEWTLKQQELAATPIAEITAASLPYAQDATVQAFMYEISENLKSEEVRKAATDALVEYLTGKQRAAASSSAAAAGAGAGAETSAAAAAAAAMGATTSRVSEATEPPPPPR